VSDGLNIYPPVRGRAPTAAEVRRSEAIDVAPKNTVKEDSKPTQQEPTPPTSCDDVSDPPPDNFVLSTTFTLGMLSTQAVISHYRVQAQAGLTVQDIVCNLQGLAKNVLESIASKYGRAKFIVTSGFRPGSGTSQHERGQAADIQFPGFSRKDLYEAAVWIKDNINFDQMILEWPSPRGWIHLSFNRSGNRSNSDSNKFGTCTSAGNYVWLKLLHRE